MSVSTVYHTHTHANQCSRFRKCKCLEVGIWRHAYSYGVHCRPNRCKSMHPLWNIFTNVGWTFRKTILPLKIVNRNNFNVNVKYPICCFLLVFNPQLRGKGWSHVAYLVSLKGPYPIANAGPLTLFRYLERFSHNSTDYNEKRNVRRRGYFGAK